MSRSTTASAAPPHASRRRLGSPPFVSTGTGTAAASALRPQRQQHDPSPGRSEAALSRHELRVDHRTAQILLLTGPDRTCADALPALAHLPQAGAPALGRGAGSGPSDLADLILCDTPYVQRVHAAISVHLPATSHRPPILAVADESTLDHLPRDFAFDGLILTSTGPAELELRISLAVGQLERRSRRATQQQPTKQRRFEASPAGAVIDLSRHAMTVDGVDLDLTATEFALVRHLAQQPGHAFSREQLARDVCGLRTYEGSRTVDAHVGHLRAKLARADLTIDTVRKVGYRIRGTHSPIVVQDGIQPTAAAR